MLPQGSIFFCAGLCNRAGEIGIEPVHKKEKAPQGHKIV